MPRFFDDYSNTYLTHDSSAGRKQQRRGWKFRENFRLNYEPYVDEWRRGPMGLASAQQAFMKARPNDPAVPPLPEGWNEDVDGVTGITFYVDSNTGKRTWVRPGFIPPPPGAGRPPPMGGPPPQYGNRGPPPPMFGAGQRGPPPPMQQQPPPINMQQQQQQPPPQHYGAGQAVPPPNTQMPPMPMPPQQQPPPPQG